MKTVYLIVTTPDLTQIAVVPGPTGWQLPRWDRLKRIPPANGAQPPPLAAYVSSKDIVHWAPLPPEDVSDTSDCYYCAAVTAELAGHRDDREGREFVLLKRRDAQSPDALPGREHLAVRLALARLETPVVTFDSPYEVQAALSWAERHMAATMGATVASIARYRQNRRDLIVRFETNTDAVYLKAGKERFADEAMLTQHLHTLLPGRVPETLATDHVHHRWLYRELPGVMMAAAPLERHTVVAAIRALVDLQQASARSQAIECLVAPRRQTAVELFHAVDERIGRAWRSVGVSDVLASVMDTWGTLRHKMLKACAAADALDVPPVLVPSDFWSQNILVMPDGIGFIDLGHSFWSCPVLPLWRFVRDVKRLWSSRDPAEWASIRHEIGTAFVDAWAPAIPTETMIRAVGQMWLIGRLFGIQIASVDLDLFEEAAGTPLPAGYKASRLVGRVRELSRAFAQHVIVPRPERPELAAALDL